MLITVLTDDLPDPFSYSHKRKPQTVSSCSIVQLYKMNVFSNLIESFASSQLLTVLVIHPNPFQFAQDGALTFLKEAYRGFETLRLTVQRL